MNDPLVSVVITCFNGAELLNDCVRSVVDQNTSCEIIVVDDGSGDASVERAQFMMRELPVSMVVVSQKNQGPAAARNLGLRMVRGEYVSFLDPDDRFAPEHLERAIETIERSGSQVAVATARLVIERTNASASLSETLGVFAPIGGDGDSVNALRVAHSIPLACLVFYRGLLDAAGRFDEGLALLEDWDYVLRLVALTPFAMTGAMTVDLTARLGLLSQRLGALYPHYLASLDRVYTSHRVDDAGDKFRAGHRATVAAALAAGRDWISEPNGLGAFMCALAGRTAAAPAAR